MKKKSKKKIISILLAAAMVLLIAGCGGGTGSAGGASGSDNADAASTGGSAGTQTQNGDSSNADGQTAMGRYVEEEFDLSEQLSQPLAMCMLEDGSIVILDSTAGVLMSKDQGITWSDETPDWFITMKNEGAYITSMAMAPDGTAAVAYDPDMGDDDYSPIAKLIMPDGTEVPAEIAFTDEDMYVSQVIASDEGRFFVDTVHSIYEIHEDGSSEKILTPEDSSWVWVKGNLLFVDSDWEAVDAPMIYDLDAKDYVEDSVLMEFTDDNYPGRNYNGSYSGSMHLMPGDNGTVYVIGSKGIHRHVIGGNMMEQIVDGNLSMLSNPDYHIVSMIQLEEESFLVLFANHKLIRFTYDPNVPSVPENMLTIYSLREDDSIRQSISLYQAQHPDTFVSYEIGMSEGDAVTREDALKRLNTEIVAGSGPDLIVLDDMPISSYVDKGLLLDLTDYFEQYSAKEPLFDNIIEALKIDGKAYMAPLKISLPMIAAPEEYTKIMTDLSGIADAVEQMRAEHPGENIIGVCSPAGVMKRFASTSAPEWVMEDGTLDLESLKEYLEQCKRIYDAQMDGLGADIVQRYNERSERMAAYDGVDEYMYNERLHLKILDYIINEVYILPGWTVAAYDFMEVMSLNKTKGFEDAKVVPMEGQCSNVFLPQTMIGINATSGQIDAAKGFMDVFLSAVNMPSTYDGFPLNQGAFDIQFTPREGDVWGENGEYISWSTGDADGNIISFQGYWPTDEQIAALKSQLASVDTAYIPDSVLEKAVFDGGTDYIKGNRNLEDALSAIDKMVALYMAE